MYSSKSLSEWERKSADRTKLEFERARERWCVMNAWYGCTITTARAECYSKCRVPSIRKRGLLFDLRWQLCAAKAYIDIYVYSSVFICVHVLAHASKVRKHRIPIPLLAHLPPPQTLSIFGIASPWRQVVGLAPMCVFILHLYSLYVRSNFIVRMNYGFVCQEMSAVMWLSSHRIVHSTRSRVCSQLGTGGGGIEAFARISGRRRRYAWLYKR